MQAALNILQRFYGYSAFRDGQESIVSSILKGRDTVGIMPTGGGKSICYQVPSLLLPGTTIVISPLISLMKDQVDALTELGIPATFINSSLTYGETEQRIRAAANGEYKLLYIAPERLETERFRSLVSAVTVPLVAIDEAHCLSQWGHDFRPSYLAVAPFLRQLAKRPIVAAFTATATEEVTHDIIRLLDLRDVELQISGFDRANLTLNVLRGVNKRDYVLRYVGDNKDQAGIIYAATRKEVDELQAALQHKGIAAGKYHAGLSDDERMSSQEAFLYDDIRVMVATNAFGMGIDKSNVRYVLHYNMPKNMEAYYQEAGRAGRDGEPSECFLLFSPQDVQTQKFLIEQSVSSPERKTHEYRKLQTMIDYCYTQQCLRAHILEYFGETQHDGRCGNCSSCLDDSELVDITLEAQKICSCIRRMNERFGVTLVAQVLKGSGNKRVSEFGFTQLPTFGAMKEYTEKAIADLIHVLIAEGYLALSEGQYPVVRLAQKAVGVLKGQERVMQRIPKKKQAAEIGGQALFEQLRQLRKQLADQERVPPYIIFADSTLRELSQVVPASAAEMLEIKGIGEAKFRKYGRPFLELLQTYAGIEAGDAGGFGDEWIAGADTGMPASVPVAAPEGVSAVSQMSKRFAAPASLSLRPAGDENSDNVPSHVVSLHMFRAGAAPEEIARERGMGLITIQDHIIRCATEGHDLDWDAIIPPEQEPLILEQIERLGAEKLKPLKEALPEEIGYFTIKAVLVKHRSLE